MPRAAIYTRISRDSLVGGVAQAGVERQEADCRALADSHGFEVVEVHSDNDLSAYSGRRRPGYEALLASIEGGRIDVVLVWHTDRLYRRVSTLMDYISACKPNGVRTFAVMAGEIALDTPTGEATAVTIAAWSQHESAMKGKRQTAANAQRARQGKSVSSGRVFGYETDGKTLRSVEAEAVQRAYQAIIDGISLASICRQWNDAGLLTSRKSRTWDSTLLSQLLRSPRYAGLKAYDPRGVRDAKKRGHSLIYNEDGTPVRGKWEPVVDEDTWRAAQAVLADPARRWAHPPQLLLSGVALCGVCGAVMHSGGTRKSANGEQRRIRCSAKAGHAYRESAPIEEFVTRVILEYLRRPGILQALTASDDLADSAAATRQQLADLQVRSDSLVGLLVEGVMSEQQFRDGQARLQEKMAELESRLPSTVSRTAVRIASASAPEEVWGQLSDDERRVVINELMVVEVLPSGTKEATYLDWRRRILNPESLRITWRHQVASGSSESPGL